MNCIYALLTLQPCPSFVSCGILSWPWRRGISFFRTCLVNILVDCGGQNCDRSRKNDLLIWMKLGSALKRVMGQSIMNLHLKGDSRQQWGKWKMVHHTHESVQLLLGTLHHKNVMESGGRWRRVAATWLPETFNLPLPSFGPGFWNTLCQTKHTANRVSLMYSIPYCKKSGVTLLIVSKNSLFQISKNLQYGWMGGQFS